MNDRQKLEKFNDDFIVYLNHKFGLDISGQIPVAGESYTPEWYSNREYFAYDGVFLCLGDQYSRTANPIYQYLDEEGIKFMNRFMFSGMKERPEDEEPFISGAVKIKTLYNFIFVKGVTQEHGNLIKLLFSDIEFLEYKVFRAIHFQKLGIPEKYLKPYIIH